MRGAADIAAPSVSGLMTEERGSLQNDDQAHLNADPKDSESQLEDEAIEEV